MVGLAAKILTLMDALEGKVSDHHRFLIRMHLEHLAYLEQAIAQLHQRIDEKIRPYQHQIDLIKTNPGFDTVAARHR